MPIATPEVYAEMLDRAKAGSFAYPAINVIVVARRSTPRSRASPRPAVDGIVQVSTGGAEYLSGPTIKDMVTGSVALRGVRRTRSPRTTRSTSRCTPTTAPRTSSTASSARCSQHPPSGSRPASTPLFQSHMWDGSAVPLDENLQIAQELLAAAPRPRNIILEIEIGVVGGEEDGVDGAIDEQALHHARGRPRHGRGARPRRERPLPDRADLRQRARRLQAGQRQAAPGDPQGGPGRGRREARPRRPAPSRSTWSSTAAPARCPRRSRAAVDYGVVKMNVDTDTQYAFTRPVADHMFTQLRRRAQGRRRGRQQEGLRPARLGQGGRGRHGRPRRRGLREPALGGHARADPARPAIERSSNLARRVHPTTPASPDGRPSASADPPARRPRRRASTGGTEQVAAAHPASSPGLGGARRGRARRRTATSRPTPTPAPATTAASTRCASRAGAARARPVGARAQPRLPARARGAGPGGRRRSARPRRCTGAPSSCATLERHRGPRARPLRPTPAVPPGHDGGPGRERPGPPRTAVSRAHRAAGASLSPRNAHPMVPCNRGCASPSCLAAATRGATLGCHWQVTATHAGVGGGPHGRPRDIRRGRAPRARGAAQARARPHRGAAPRPRRVPRAAVEGHQHRAGATEPPSEPISDAIAPSVVNRLLTETTGMLRNFVLTISEGPALDESTMRANEDRIRRGEQQRAVYPASALSSPQGQRWMSVWSEVGEDQRILPEHRHRVRGLRRHGGRGAGRLGRPRPGVRRDPRPAHRAALHRLLRPRLEARGARRRPSAGARAAATPSSSSCSSSA